MKKQKFQTLLFDADGTLLDFKACEKNALEKVFRQYKIPFYDAIRTAYHTLNNALWKDYEKGIIDRNTVIYSRFDKLFAAYGIDADGIAFEDDYQNFLGEGHEMMPDAKEVLQQLSKRYELYIATNGVAATQKRRLRESGIDIYMKDIFISEHIGYQKPQKEYFDACFAKMSGACRNSTLIIGDSLSSDIKGGNVAGIATCWINVEKEVNTEQFLVDYEISGLKELLEFL